MDNAVAKVRKHQPKPKRVVSTVKAKPQQSPRFDDGDAPTEKKATDWRSRTADISRTLRKIRPGPDKHKPLESVMVNSDGLDRVEDSSKEGASTTPIAESSSNGFQFDLEEESSNEIVFTIDPNVNYPLVKSATIDKLVERLTHEKYPGLYFLSFVRNFQPSSYDLIDTVDVEFRNAFLLTYRSIISPIKLLEKIVARYPFNHHY